MLGLMGALLAVLPAYAIVSTADRNLCCQHAKHATKFQSAGRTAIKLFRLTSPYSFLCTRKTSYIDRAPQAEDAALKNQFF